MAKEKNLKPFTSEQSREKAVENGRKGGKASGEAKRERKAMRELMQSALDTNIKAGDEMIPAREAMLLKLMQSALEGDLASVKYIIELIGEAPSQKVEVTGKDGKDLYKYERELSREEARKFVEELGKEYGWSGYE